MRQSRDSLKCLLWLAYPLGKPFFCGPIAESENGDSHDADILLFIAAGLLTINRATDSVIPVLVRVVRTIAASIRWRETIASPTMSGCERNP